MTESDEEASSAAAGPLPGVEGGSEAIRDPVWTAIDDLRRHIAARQILGRDGFIERLLIALLADGHLLVTGAPGLAKASAVKALAAGVGAGFQRIQLTPDMLPADLMGIRALRPDGDGLDLDGGSISHDLLLAEGLDRAPPRVQSVLFEAVEEYQLAVGREICALPRLLLVIATQDPTEREAVHPLPRAQLDRFLMHVRLDYPQLGTERALLHRHREAARTADDSGVAAHVSQATLSHARRRVLDLHLAPEVEDYLLHLVLATRTPEEYGAALAGWLRCGAGPCATWALDRSARAHAWLAGRDYVSPEDLQLVAADVLRHRLSLGSEAAAAGRTVDDFVAELLAVIPLP